MRIIVLADTGWSIGRVHSDVARELPEHTFVFYDQGCFIFENFLNDVKKSDILFTTHNNYYYISSLYTNPKDRRKIAIIAHGVSELINVKNSENYKGLSDDFTYGVTSDVLVPFHSMKVYVTPNGINSDLFTYTPRSGKVETLGWCGAHRVKIKRIDWSYKIASSTNLSISIAMTLPFNKLLEWYKTIDIFLVTSGPDVSEESGPLPPFEAIASGVLVIGTFVGNFRNVPGPKFETIDEAVEIINELKNKPELVRELAKEQYDYVIANNTYKNLAKKWDILFTETFRKSQEYA